MMHQSASLGFALLRINRRGEGFFLFLFSILFHLFPQLLGLNHITIYINFL